VYAATKLAAMSNAMVRIVATFRSSSGIALTPPGANIDGGYPEPAR
jgi:hypothetical protein